VGLSPRNVAAIGDAENDHALLRTAEYAVAVANAARMLQREADREFDHRRPARAPRRPIALGIRGDGTAVHLAPLGGNLLVAGASASGKSALVTALLDRVAAAGYQFCVFDPDGDYAGLPGALVFGDAQCGPGAAEAFTALEKPAAGVVLNLNGRAGDRRVPGLAVRRGLDRLSPARRAPGSARRAGQSRRAPGDRRRRRS
jgi:hypothetical protein